MKGYNLMKTSTIAMVIGATSLVSLSASADTSGKFYGDARLRYENVQQDNALADANALTLRTRLGYKTPTKNGFSGVVEIENSTALVDNYSFPPVGLNAGEFSVVADPDSDTEVDQAFAQYKGGNFDVKVGRQVIALDGQRFIGHVGFRQDRQTFDALSATYAPSASSKFTYAYINKRNRIFADNLDLDAKDHLLNASFKFGSGKLTPYAYLLEVDEGADNSLDTYGVSYTGKAAGFSYNAEVAQQEANDTFDATYFALGAGKKLGKVTVKLGYESLGSDDGNYGFSTPLATLHKFNGWADQFLATPAQGLNDLKLSVSGKFAGGSWSAAYHDFSADESMGGADDLGSEFDISYAKKFGKRYSGGIKYATYDAGDAAFGKVDTDKLWVWLGAKF